MPKLPGVSHSHADDSQLTDDDIIVRYEEGQIVGITILNASKRVS